MFGDLGVQPEEPRSPCTAIAPAPVQSLVEIPVAALGGQALAPAEANQMTVRPPRTRKTVAHELPPEEAPVFRPVAVLRIGEAELSLTNDISSRLMRQLKELLGNAE